MSHEPLTIKNPLVNELFNYLSSVFGIRCSQRIPIPALASYFFGGDSLVRSHVCLIHLARGSGGDQEVGGRHRDGSGRRGLDSQGWRL